MRIAVLPLLSAALFAETHTLTLRQAIDLALKQNPEVLMARLDEQKAAESVREARDPFSTRLVVGSGLAYTNGFPMSIEGSAPSILQARAIQAIYNRPLSFRVAAARENARGASIDSAARRDEVAHRVATMHITAERAARVSQLASEQIGSYERIAGAVRARIEEGREVPVEGRAAELRLALARQRLRSLEAERDNAEAALAVALGYPPGDRVRAATEERAAPEMPASEDAAVEEALANSKQVRRLESSMQVRQLQAQSARAGRWPQVDLVAQYGLMARFNNYEEFFRRFQRHNGQLGVSFQLPIFAGAASKSQAAQSEIDISRLRLEMSSVRNQVTLDTRRAWSDLRVAESARDVARLDLDVTRERLSVALAQMEEGRVALRQVEELRSAEMEKWLAYYDAQHMVERARLELLRNTGSIIAAVR